MCHGCAQTRMKKLEQVRLEVDSRRHTVSQLAQKIEKQRAKLTAVGDRAKSEENIEATIRRMQHKENKLAGARRPATVQRCMCILSQGAGMPVLCKPLVPVHNVR